MFLSLFLFFAFNKFHYRAHLRVTRDIDIAILSVTVCPSVRLSVRDTLVLYENGLTYRHVFTMR